VEEADPGVAVVVGGRGFAGVENFLFGGLGRGPVAGELIGEGLLDEEVAVVGLAG